MTGTATPPSTSTVADAQAAAAQRSSWPSFIASLQYPEYRNLWIGMFVSNIGTWIKMIAQGWLVYTLTDSPLYLGLVGLARAVPVVLLTPVTGVLADRMDRRWLM